MSQAIVTLLKDDRTRLSLGEYARNRVKNTFDWRTIVVQYEEVFHNFN
jgi:glycosyltransferase involved in cell wall biosynthesis